MFLNKFNHFLLFIAFFLQLAFAHHDWSTAKAKIVKVARAYIFKAVENPNSMALETIGVVDIHEEGHRKVMLNGTINGLTPGKHGFHIHQFGDLSQLCAGAGPHFNPHNKAHGGPDSAERHIGDLGNVEADANGVVIVRLEDTQVALNGVHHVIGRGLVIHEKEDDFGKGENEESKKTGNAGKRLGCGVIGILKEQ